MQSTTALVCEKWELPLIEGSSGFFQHTNVGELSRRAICFEWLMKDIPLGTSVAEYFGGIGLQTLIIRELVLPLVHEIYDLDEDCVAQLKQVFSNEIGVIIGQRDAHRTIPFNIADLVVLDFPNMTAKHYLEWHEPLQSLFSKSPKYVEITDVGNRYLHLHRPLYSSILDHSVDTIEDYITAISLYMRYRYGYSVVKAAYKSGTSYMLFQQVPQGDIEFFKVGPTSAGFRYLDS